MERSQIDQFAGAPNTLAIIYRTNAFERAQAQKQMDRAMVVAELVLATAARLRNALNIAGQAVQKFYGRARVAI